MYSEKKRYVETAGFIKLCLKYIPSNEMQKREFKCFINYLTFKDKQELQNQENLDRQVNSCAMDTTNYESFMVQIVRETSRNPSLLEFIKLCVGYVPIDEFLQMQFLSLYNFSSILDEVEQELKQNEAEQTECNIAKPIKSFVLLSEDDKQIVIAELKFVVSAYYLEPFSNSLITNLKMSAITALRHLRDYFPNVNEVNRAIFQKNIPIVVENKVEGDRAFFANGCEPLEIIKPENKPLHIYVGNKGSLSLTFNDIEILPTGGDVMVTLYIPKTRNTYTHMLSENDG